MGKVYLATKAEVQAVSDSVQTVESQLNTATTGVIARVVSLENGSAQVVQNTSDIAALDTQINDATTGLVKQVTDISNDINTSGTGIKARLTDLEQGGIATMKFRTHTPNGVYEDGEVVQKDGKLYKANSAINGSSVAVPFVEGTITDTWTELSAAPKGTASRAAVFNAGGSVVSSNVTTTELNALSGVTSSVQTQLNTIANGILTRVPKGYASDPSIESRIAVIDTNGAVNYGTLTSATTAAVVTAVNGSGVSQTELSYVKGVTSDIQTQLAGKQATISGAASTIATANLSTDRALISNGSGKVATSSVTSTELSYVSGVTSSIQSQLNAATKTRTNMDVGSYGTSNTSWATIVSYESFAINGRYNTSNPARLYNTTGGSVNVFWETVLLGSTSTGYENIANNGEFQIVGPTNNGDVKTCTFMAYNSSLVWSGRIHMYKTSTGTRVTAELSVSPAS